MTNRNVEEHESFGTITFSRTQMSGSGQRGVPLFGSSILHNEGIMLEIHEADRRRDLSQDRIHPRRYVLRAMLSPSQFMDAFTRLNQGVGSPITLEYVSGDEKERRDPPPPPRTHQQFDQEAEQHIDELVRRVDELIDASRGSAKRKAEAVKQQIEANIPFVRRQLRRQMDQTVTEAKSEFEAHVAHRLEELALEGLRERMPSLPESQPTDALPGEVERIESDIADIDRAIESGDTQVTVTLCPPCEANHEGGAPCFALMDSENGCQCECDSSMGDIEGVAARDIGRRAG